MNSEQNISPEKAFEQFNKIRFINSITDSIANYGVQCGMTDFFDILDMNCGAVPDGEMNQVIDPAAPVQFLSLYTKISQDRFAMAVIQVARLSPVCKNAICQFIADIGRQNQLSAGAPNTENVPNAEHAPDIPNTPVQAFEILQSFVLDGMPETPPEIICKNETAIIWKKTGTSTEESWQKFGGDISFYNELLKIFADNLFEPNGLTFTAENGLYKIALK